MVLILTIVGVNLYCILTQVNVNFTNKRLINKNILENNMFGWFKKRDDKKIEELESSVKNSFQNMRTDMNQVSQWIGHFKTKHEEHHTKIQEHHTKIEDIYNKLKDLEDLLAVKSAVLNPEFSKVRVQDTKVVELNQSFDEGKEKLLELKVQVDPLPEGQQRVCECLAALQREQPDTWSSLSKLADEVYPGREYDKVRSAILQLVNILEAEGYLIKRKVRKSVYVYLKKEKMSLFKGINELNKISQLKKSKKS